MKILIIQGGVDADLVTGEEVVIRNDINYLKKNGVNVIYQQIKIPSSGLSSVFGKLGGLIWSFSNYKKIKNSINNNKPDLLHFHTIVPYLSFSVVTAANNSKLPVVQTLHNGRWICLEGAYHRDNTFCDDCIGSYGWLGVKRGCSHGQFISFLLFLTNFITRKFGFLFKYISKFIAVSNFVQNQHIKTGFDENKIIVRNNVINIQHSLDLDDSWLHRDGLVYAGRLSVAKGSKVLKHLIKNLDCKIKIIGNGPELKFLKQYCNDNKFNQVDFFGKLSNKETLEIIKKSVVTVIPSQCGDSYPTVALESLSVGTPVVASNLGGLPDIINSSRGGKLSDYDNNNAFMKNIKALLNNREEAKKMGNNGIKYIKENVDANKQSKELIRIYNQVIKDYKLSK